MFEKPRPFSPSRYQEARRVTLIGAALNIFLGIIKVLVGIAGHSHALLADGVHSFSDLAVDLLVVFAAKYGSQAADHDHPYGHRRIETAATVALAIFLIAVGITIIVNGGARLVNVKNLEIPHYYVLLVAGLSVLINEWIFLYTLRVARRIGSELLRANAWHRRSDAASSLVVLLGVGGALAGFTFLDQVAAIAVGAMISKMGWDLGWKNLRELVDTGVDDKTLQNIKQIILRVPGVQGIHDLRSRFMGGEIFVDVHVLVDPHLSVSEGHYIGEQVHLALLHAQNAVTDVVVHVDPEDDKMAALSVGLPPRQTLLTQLRKRWETLPGAAIIQTIRLDYLAGKIVVEVHLPWTVLTDSGLSPAELAQAYRNAAQGIQSVTDVRVMFEK